MQYSILTELLSACSYFSVNTFRYTSVRTYSQLYPVPLQIKQVWRWNDDPEPSNASSLSTPQGSVSPLSPEVQFCSICQSAGATLLCSKCGRAFHSDCHIPPIFVSPWWENGDAWCERSLYLLLNEAKSCHCDWTFLYGVLLSLAVRIGCVCCVWMSTMR